MEPYTKVTRVQLKKEFIGPGLHLRPVHADHAQPPFQWTLNSVFSAYENNNRRIRPPPDRGTLKIVSRLLMPKRKHTLITPSSRQAINFSLSIGMLPQVYWLLANCLTVWAHEHIACESWGYWDCLFLGLCKSQGLWSVGFRHVHMGYKRFSQMLIRVFG